MATLLTIDVDTKEVERVLAELRENIADLTPAMRDIADELLFNVQETFDASQDPWGGAWQPLSPNNKKRIGGKPLLDTRQNLYNKLTRQFDNNSAVVGLSTPIAMIHQFGGKAGRGNKVNIPARPYLPIRNDQVDLPEEWERSLIDIIWDRILPG